MVQATVWEYGRCEGHWLHLIRGGAPWSKSNGQTFLAAHPALFPPAIADRTKQSAIYPHLVAARFPTAAAPFVLHVQFLGIFVDLDL